CCYVLSPQHSCEMSEKLRRCRKELTAAIDRAFEDLTAPFCLSEDCINKQNSDLQTETPSSLPQMNRVSYRRDPTSTLSSYLNQSAAVSCVLEKKNPVFIPNLIPVSVAQNPLCPKREPLTSKENTWLRSSIFVSDRQLPRTLGDRERWRKGHARYKQHSDTETGTTKKKINLLLVASDSDDETEHASIRNPNSWGIEELAGQLALVNELSRVHRRSGEPPLRDDVLAIFMDASSSSETRHRRPNTEDEEIIQTVLDLEEDYSTAISALHQLN
uniref:Chromosome 3 open reading frame 62 n=1 Tax=Terrapene triunguis TaxID=2587831 RepID=A0A674K7T9_9SAUR